MAGGFAGCLQFTPAVIMHLFTKPMMLGSGRAIDRSIREYSYMSTDGMRRDFVFVHDLSF